MTNEWHPLDHREVGERYDRIWERDPYQGFGSAGKKGAVATPLLEIIGQALSSLGRAGATVVELGAGSGAQSIWLAEKGHTVTAVEHSPVAAEKIAREIETKNSDVQRRITVVCADMFDFIEHMTDPVDALYAAVVVHTFSAEQRKALYALFSNRQSSGGIVGVSLKAAGGALEQKGNIVQQTTSGPIVLGNDGIARLCVTNVEPLIEEFQRSGYRVDETDVMHWSVDGYNIPGKTENFIGIVAHKI